MAACLLTRILSVALVSTLLASAPAQPPPPDARPGSLPATLPVLRRPDLPARGELHELAPRVALEIGRGDEDWGRIVVELDRENAPFTVRSFLRYVDEGFYDGTIFHRVIPDYLVQGGGFSALDQPKKTAAHGPLRNESTNQLKNLRYTIAMARGRDPHSATTQFFINLADNPKLDYPGHDGWGYCVFGLVVSGREVLDRIKSVETRPHPHVASEVSRPVDPPVLRRAYRLPPEAAHSGAAAAGAATVPEPVRQREEPPPASDLGADRVAEPEPGIEPGPSP